jgi:hypothetical protein
VGVNLASTEGFAIDISPLKALLQAVNSDASKAVLAQIGDKEGVTPFDTANITPAEIRLKNKDMDLVISLTELSKIF